VATGDFPGSLLTGDLTSCIYQVSFKPPYGGPWVGTMVVAYNNLNTLSPSQTIPLMASSLRVRLRMKAA
jgi:hypothetical protein